MKMGGKKTRDGWNIEQVVGAIRDMEGDKKGGK